MEETKEKGTILLIEDDSVQTRVITIQLARAGFKVESAKTGEEGLHLALNSDIDAVITDVGLPEISGLDLLEKIHKKKPMLPVIVITGFGTTDTAIEATKLGAFDYLVKPIKPNELLDALNKGISSHRLSTESIGMGPGTTSETTIIGQCPAMQHLFKEIGKAARQEMPVLVQGDTGTGKELVSRAIYKHSSRADKPFIALNCAAIPEQLLESELFGHEKGAFTGATYRRIGRFEQANGGTIFLDEIGDLSLPTQAKLLRVLQEKKIQRLGGNERIHVNARVIAATHRNLSQAILRHEFREDLYFRLNVMRIRVPSLYERLDDVQDLVAYFLKRYASKLGMPNVTIGTAAIEAMLAYHWPGNVRELENVVRKCIIASQGYQITAAIVRSVIERASEPIESAFEDDSETALERLANRAVDQTIDDELEGAAEAFLSKCERLVYKRALERTQGNKSKAAQILGVSRVTIREKAKRYNLP